jgi:6-phosphofructokinase 2
MQTVITLTMNPTLDKSATVVNVVAERKLRCEPPRHEPGGGGVNVSRAIQRLGGESLALYPAGGPTGQMLQDLLDQEGLNHHPIPIENLTRQNLTVLEESTGQQFRFGMPGPMLRDAEWQRCLDELSGIDPKSDYIVASGSLPPGVAEDFYARVARLARDLGSRTLVDTSEEALCLAAREGVYLLKPNMRELRQLAGCEIKDESEQEAVAEEIVESGQAEVVVVSLGSAGALLVSSEGSERLRAPTVPIESKIGAGDSMVAGIVLGLARGQALPDAVRFGMAAGAAAVMTHGTELCRREDTERLYERMISETT